MTQGYRAPLARSRRLDMNWLNFRMPCHGRGRGWREGAGGARVGVTRECGRRGRMRRRRGCRCLRRWRLTEPGRQICTGAVDGRPGAHSAPRNRRRARFGASSAVWGGICPPQTAKTAPNATSRAGAPHRPAAHPPAAARPPGTAETAPTHSPNPTTPRAHENGDAPATRGSAGASNGCRHPGAPAEITAAPGHKPSAPAGITAAPGHAPGAWPESPPRRATHPTG